ncbi:MAG: hypothetical protein AAFO72_07680 [Pseudomonadota bacterium]
MNDRARDIDEAAFGVIYGTITIMGVLAATDTSHFDPLTTGLTLFLAVLAVALAKTYADLASKALAAGRGHSATTIRAAWVHSRTTLLAANGPTLAMLAGAAGLYDGAIAMVLAQSCAVGLLLFYGWRIGWRITGRALPSGLSALSMGAVGLALTALKYAVH